jgi:hypothetical protein
MQTKRMGVYGYTWIRPLPALVPDSRLGKRHRMNPTHWYRGYRASCMGPTFLPAYGLTQLRGVQQRRNE